MGKRTDRNRTETASAPKRADRKTRRPVAAFDLDGTLIREQLLVLLSEECFRLQIFRPVAEAAFREVRRHHRDREIAFEDYDRRIIDIFADRVRGRRHSDVKFAAKIVFEQNRGWLYRFTRALLEEVTKTHDAIAVTGAMQETVSLLAPYWGFMSWYASVLEVDKRGRYTGRQLSLPVRDKGAAVRKHARRHRSTLAGSIAIGDTLSDASMLRVVDKPIVFNPDDKLAEIADEHGWPIVTERKDCIYVMHRDRFRRFSSDDARAAVTYVLGLQP